MTVKKLTESTVYNDSNTNMSLNHLQIYNSTAQNNGGGIYNDNNATLTVQNSLFRNANALTGSGGGIYNAGNPTVNQCTFTNCTAGAAGGAIRDTAGTGTGNGNTVNGNQVTGVPGALNAGGGIAVDAGATFKMVNSIVADNTAPNDADVVGTFTDLGHNFIGDGTSSDSFVNGENGDQVGNGTNPLNPMLGPLQDNGGGLDTELPLAGSPVIDVGDNSYAAATDARGYIRIINNIVDLGAVEYNSYPAAASVTLTSSLNSAAPNQAVTFTANVSGNSVLPTGSVTFMADNTVLGTSTLDSSDNATFTTSTLTLGQHTITAVYDGDDNYPSSAGFLTQTIAQYGSTTTLSADNSPSTLGQAVIFTANVTSAMSVPTGSVTFYDGNNVLGTSPVDANGNATYTTSSLVLGNHDIIAIFNGGDDYTSSSGSLSQQVNLIGTFTTLNSDTNPSQPNDPVQFTAVVSEVNGNGMPSGNVTFYNGSSVLGTVALALVNGQMQASLTTSFGTGNYNITAVYNGDDSHLSSSGSDLQTVGQPSTGTSSTLVSSSLSPSLPGQQVTFTASVTGGSATPTGTVTFYDGTTPLGTYSLDANGNATYTTSTLALGDHNITAIYSGDGNYAGSTGGYDQTVALGATSTTLSADVQPSLPDQQVTFTATVSNGSSTPPTGTVTFYDGTTVLGTAPVDANGNATFSTSALTLGDHNITAVYSGDDTNAGSAGSWTQSVVQAGTTTSLTSSANPSPQGQDVTFTATVAAMDPSSGTPSGSVDFYDGSTFLGSGTLSLVNGQYQATFTTAALGLGSHTIVALYSGDSTFADSGTSMEESIAS